MISCYLVEQGRVAEVSAVVLVHGVAGVHVGSVLAWQVAGSGAGNEANNREGG